LDRVALNTPVELRDFALMKRKRYMETNDQLDLQIASMSLKLSLFFNMEENKLRHVMTPYDYLKNSLSKGANFSNDLKSARGLATLSTFAIIRFTDLDEKIDEFNNENTSGFFIDRDRKYAYDDFLSESYTLFFEDKSVDDFKWSQEPLEEDEEALSHFRTALRQVLSLYRVKALEDPDDSDKSTWVSDSTVFESGDVENSGPGRNKARKAALEGSKNPFGKLTDSFRFRRSIIPVAPGNWRDSWEPDRDTLFTIKSISHVMRPVVQQIPFSAMYDPTIAYRRKQFMRKNTNRLYLMLDYKKSALTINRTLLTIMGEELSSIYPEVSTFEWIKYYKDLKVYKDKKWLTPVRGVGLGNMNELYTLMQCAFGFIAKEEFNTKSIFFNDDAVYELHPTLYRTQVIRILSLIKKCGCIVNLKKSVVSRYNIFCEDYVTEEGLDYSKRQLLVVPIAGAAFCSTLAQAKKYVYGINRLLIGTGYRELSVQFINILTKLYKPEFGKMDIYLPYHLGGYVDFSPTNFSCLVEYILDPGCYLRTTTEQGHIPEIRRWTRYLLLKKKSGGGLLSSKARIAYRGEKAVNILKYIDPLKQVGGLSQLVYDYAKLQSPVEFEQNLDDLLNYRGLHNAKPTLKMGLEMKEDRRRRNLFKEYKDFSKRKTLSLLSKDCYGLGQVLSMTKDVPDAPSYFGFPRCFVEKSSPQFESNRDRMVSFVKEEQLGSSPKKIRRAISSTLESVLLKRWIPYSDPFIFYDLWRNRKSGYLISDKKLPRIFGHFYNLPSMFRAFCPNKRLFITELDLRLGSHANTYKDTDISGSGLEMILLKDAFEIVLPNDLIGRWRSIKKVYKDYLSEIREILAEVPLNSRAEFKSALDTIEMIFENHHKDDFDPWENREHDHDLHDFLERIEEENLLTSLIGLEQDIDRLIDEESDYYSILSDTEVEEDEGEVDFEFDDSDYSEESVEEVSQNEVRRLVRYYDELTRIR
jgi:hypothetical protein